MTDLALLYGVDTLLLPLYWWDLFPHQVCSCFMLVLNHLVIRPFPQLSHSAEAAWARGLQVHCTTLSPVHYATPGEPASSQCARPVLLELRLRHLHTKVDCNYFFNNLVFHELVIYSCCQRSCRVLPRPEPRVPGQARHGRPGHPPRQAGGRAGQGGRGGGSSGQSVESAHHQAVDWSEYATSNIGDFPSSDGEQFGVFGGLIL